MSNSPSLQSPREPLHCPSRPHTTLSSPVVSSKVKPSLQRTLTSKPGVVAVELSLPFLGSFSAEQLTERAREGGGREKRRK